MTALPVTADLRGSLDERQLIARCIAGDARAQRELYEGHVDRVFRLSYRLAGEDELARDFTQLTFIRAFERMSEFRHDSSLATWLHAIAVSVALNGLRTVKKNRLRNVSLDDAVGVRATSAAADPDLKARLAAAIDSLSEKYRTVFLMHDVEGYTHDEIGAALGIPAGTSKTRLFQGRAKLREALADFREEWAT